MGNSTIAELKIPDLWFDLYARLLPGTLFVAFIRVVVKEIITIPTIIELVLMIFFGFLCALVIQPFSSIITSKIQKFAEWKHDQKMEKDTVRKIQYKIGRDSRDSMIISKMHAEVTFFVQIALFVIISLFYQLIFDEVIYSWLFYIITCIFFVFESYLVAKRRLLRALKAEQYIIEK